MEVDGQNNYITMSPCAGIDGDRFALWIARLNPFTPQMSSLSHLAVTVNLQRVAPLNYGRVSHSNIYIILLKRESLKI